MAEFKFNCPQCGQPIEADESYCGQTVECPRCGKGIVVPRIKLRSPLEGIVQPLNKLSKQNYESGATTRREQSPKLRRIQQKSSTDSSAGLQEPPFFPMQTNENGPSDVQSRDNLPPANNNEQETMRNDAGMVANSLVLFFVMVVFVVGGGIFVTSRCDKKCTALRSLIEQTRDRPDEKSSQLFDSVTELKETHAALLKDIEGLERRVADMEIAQKQYGEDLANQNKTLEKKCTVLLERIESLSQQVSENSSSVHQLERGRPSIQLPVQPQVIAQNEPENTDNPPEESLADLQRHLDNNLAEIKKLVKKNPACYLNPSDTSIINVAKKIATMKDRRYCACANVTFVRDAFYCTSCKRTTRYRGGMDYDGCCDVSRKQSFHRWLAVREKVDETTEINARIDELYAENESFEKQLRSMKRLRPRK